MRNIFLILFLVTGSFLYAAENVEIEGDRPYFTESPDAMPFGSIQLEGGYTFTGNGSVKEHALGELLLRMGVYHRLELRLGIESINWYDDGTETVFGKDDPSLGVKVQLMRGSRESSFLRPNISFIAGTSIPVGTTEFTEDKWQPETRLALGWFLTERISLGININYSYLYDAGWFSRFSGSAAAGFSVTDDLGLYAEYIVYAPESKGGGAAHYLSGGLTWKVTKTVQVDGRFGIQVHDDNDYFAGVGFVFLWPSVWNDKKS